MKLAIFVQGEYKLFRTSWKLNYQSENENRRGGLRIVNCNMTPSLQAESVHQSVIPSNIDCCDTAHTTEDTNTDTNTDINTDTNSDKMDLIATFHHYAQNAN